MEAADARKPYHAPAPPVEISTADLAHNVLPPGNLSEADGVTSYVES